MNICKVLQGAVIKNAFSLEKIGYFLLENWERFKGYFRLHPGPALSNDYVPSLNLLLHIVNFKKNDGFPQYVLHFQFITLEGIPTIV